MWIVPPPVHDKRLLLANRMDNQLCPSASCNSLSNSLLVAKLISTLSKCISGMPHAKTASSSFSVHLSKHWSRGEISMTFPQDAVTQGVHGSVSQTTYMTTYRSRKRIENRTVTHEQVKVLCSLSITSIHVQLLVVLRKQFRCWIFWRFLESYSDSDSQFAQKNIAHTARSSNVMSALMFGSPYLIVIVTHGHMILILFRCSNASSWTFKILWARVWTIKHIQKNRITTVSLQLLFTFWASLTYLQRETFNII